jgi:class 3 adenylate cyclase
MAVQLSLSVMAIMSPSQNTNFAGDDARAIAVHEAARIVSAALPDEIPVSSATRALAGSLGLAFESRGPRTLKGLTGEWDLYA